MVFAQHLEVESASGPLIVSDELNPEFGWQVCLEPAEEHARAVLQSACRVQVSREAGRWDHTHLMWDSGQVTSRMSRIAYGGAPLDSGTSYWWRVQLWNGTGVEGPWSESGTWSTGLLSWAGWCASRDAPAATWIMHPDEAAAEAAAAAASSTQPGAGSTAAARQHPHLRCTEGGMLVLPPAVHFRTEFVLRDEAVVRARLYITAKGILSAELNGSGLSAAPDLLAPGWTDYDVRLPYHTYDVPLSLLVAGGANALGAVVADGWYAGYIGWRQQRNHYGSTRALLAKLVVEYWDGGEQVVVSDGSWAVTTGGPVREADLLMGETYDARSDLGAWSCPGYARSRVPPPPVSASAAAPAAAPMITGGLPHCTPLPQGWVAVATAPVAQWQEVAAASAIPTISTTTTTPPSPVQPVLGPILTAQVSPPVTVFGRWLPVEQWQAAPGVWVLDMGQNFAGFVRLRVKGAPAGTRITLRFAERCESHHGPIYTTNLRSARATDTYICKGAHHTALPPAASMPCPHKPPTFTSHNRWGPLGLAPSPAAVRLVRAISPPGGGSSAASSRGSSPLASNRSSLDGGSGVRAGRGHQCAGEQAVSIGDTLSTRTSGSAVVVSTSRGVGGAGAADAGAVPAWQEPSYTSAGDLQQVAAAPAEVGGDGTWEEVWEPRFTTHGFQYVEVTGWPHPQGPGAGDVIGLAVGSDTPRTGHLETSDPQTNMVLGNAYWTQRANCVALPTDCPQRDERLGWTGDAQMYCTTATLMADMRRLLQRWLTDLGDAQADYGSFPMFAPMASLGTILDHKYSSTQDGGPAWADAGVIVPWLLYWMYGDTRTLSRAFPGIARFVAWGAGRCGPGLTPPASFHAFGDWLNIEDDTPKPLIYSAYLAHSAAIVAAAAQVVGVPASEQAQHAQLAADARVAFQQQWLVTAEPEQLAPDTGRQPEVSSTRPRYKLGAGSQCAHVLALAFGLLEGAPSGAQADIAADLVHAVSSRGPGLSTGFVGTRDLLPCLATACGRPDLAFALLHSARFPSWGFEIANGATSIWERWNGWTPDTGFNDPGMNSFSHYAYGAVGQWLFQTVGGVSPAAPGYMRVRIAPTPDVFTLPATPAGNIQLAAAPSEAVSNGEVPEAAMGPANGALAQPITWARTELELPAGPLLVAWRVARGGGRLLLHVCLPPNTEGEVVLPHLGPGPHAVAEGGTLLLDTSLDRSSQKEGGSSTRAGCLQGVLATSAMPTALPPGIQSVVHHAGCRRPPLLPVGLGVMVPGLSCREDGEEGAALAWGQEGAAWPVSGWSVVVVGSGAYNFEVVPAHEWAHGSEQDKGRAARRSARHAFTTGAARDLGAQQPAKPGARSSERQSARCIVA